MHDDKFKLGNVLEERRTDFYFPNLLTSGGILRLSAPMCNDCAFNHTVCRPCIFITVCIRLLGVSRIRVLFPQHGDVSFAHSENGRRPIHSSTLH